MRRYFIPPHPPDQFRRPDDREVRRLDRILANQEKMMATLDEVLAGVTEENTKVDSLLALLAGIKQQLDDALASPGAGTILPPDVQAKVDAIFAAVTDAKTKVQAAIDANTTGTKAGASEPAHARSGAGETGTMKSRG
jgi:hypothetical protein